jgi:hypothetical protein
MFNKEYKVKILIALLYLCFSQMVLADNEDIFLQDTKCLVVGMNGFEIVTKEGTLVTSVCVKNGSTVNCSNTAKEPFHGNKPSVVTSYLVILEDAEVALWKATSHEGVIILDLKNKRYSTSSTHILDSFFNKNCVGEIKNY